MPIALVIVSYLIVSVEGLRIVVCELALMKQAHPTAATAPTRLICHLSSEVARRSVVSVSMQLDSGLQQVVAEGVELASEKFKSIDISSRLMTKQTYRV